MKLYVFDDIELKIRIIKFIYDSLSSDHVKRAITYNRINIYYY